jgi:general nucleoside transport system permease protein
MDFGTILQILDSTVRLATPLLLACLAGLFSERAGIFDIGLEGKMLISAFFSAAIAAYTGNVWLGLLAGIGAALALSGIHGLASITFRGNQLISGVALNFLAAGITVLIAQAWFRQGGRTPSLSGDARFSPIESAAHERPRQRSRPRPRLCRDRVGPYHPRLCRDARRADLVVGAVPHALRPPPPRGGRKPCRRRHGGHLRRAPPLRRRRDLRPAAGLAGAYLATGLAAGFVKDMSAGRGFIALAALIFAKWRPWPALGACLLFGFLEAVGNRYPSLEVLGVTLPVQFMQALPYLLTVVILAGFVGRAIPPRAGGEPYVKER